MPYIIRPKMNLVSEEERIEFWSAVLGRKFLLKHRRGRSCVRNNFISCFSLKRLEKTMDRIHGGNFYLSLLKTKEKV